MDEIHCSICTKTNHIPEGQVVIIATFAQKYQAKNALFDIEKSHIAPVMSCIVSQKEILEKEFENSQTLILQLHGIKDIVQLQSLYVESICQNNGSLTIDMLTSKNSCDSFLQKLQN